MQQHAIIATNRFGLGSKPGEISTAAQGPQDWLLEKLAFPSIPQDLGGLSEMLDLFRQFHIARKNAKDKDKESEEMQLKILVQHDLDRKINQLSHDTLSRSIKASDSINWRLLDFFSNHFSVSRSTPVMKATAPLLEREAIAPNILGQFEVLLLAVIKHPGMLLYLNNDQSFGPDSALVKKKSKRNRDRKFGLNENLAREILELHTIGVDGGYTQNDIIEFAKAITGWNVQPTNRIKKSHSDRNYIFRDNAHQPGNRILLGKTYKAENEQQGEAMLRDLARHPSTAKFVSFKLARHFIADQPSSALVNSMTQAWLRSNGNLKHVVRTLIQHPDAWHPERYKFKTPRELLQSSYRGLAITPTNNSQLLQDLSILGQAPFEAGSPAGYPDTADHWHDGTAMLSRAQWAYQLAGKHPADPLNTAKSLLGKGISKHSLCNITRAESRQQGLALLLMSPEFQTR